MYVRKLNGMRGDLYDEYLIEMSVVDGVDPAPDDAVLEKVMESLQLSFGDVVCREVRMGCVTTSYEQQDCELDEAEIKQEPSTVSSMRYRVKLFWSVCEPVPDPHVDPAYYGCFSVTVG